MNLYLQKKLQKNEILILQVFINQTKKKNSFLILKLMMKITIKQAQDKYSDPQESDTYCPSIQKVKNFNKYEALFKQHKLQELLAENQLKRMGLHTAQALIQVLGQENKRLQTENKMHKLQIQSMSREYQQKQQNYQQKINCLQLKINQLQKAIQYNEERMKSEALDSCILPYSSRKLSPHQSRVTQKQNKSKYNKSRLFQSPIKKVNIIQTVSKQYISQAQSSNFNLFQEAKSKLLSCQIQNLIVNYEDMAYLVKEERQDCKAYKQKLKQKQKLVNQMNEQLINDSGNKNIQLSGYKSNSKYLSAQKCGNMNNNRKSSTKNKKIFSTQVSKGFSTWQDKVKQTSVSTQSQVGQIIGQYQQIIQQYKQYSAYLKAYLSSCINYIAKQTQCQRQQNQNIFQFLQPMRQYQYENQKQDISEILSTQRTNYLVDIPENRIFNVVIRDILNVVEQKIQYETVERKQLKRENQELKKILDELMENLKQMGIQNKGRQNYKKKISINKQWSRDRNEQLLDNNNRREQIINSQLINKMHSKDIFPKQRTRSPKQRSRSPIKSLRKQDKNNTEYQNNHKRNSQNNHKQKYSSLHHKNIKEHIKIKPQITKLTLTQFNNYYP